MTDPFVILFLIATPVMMVWLAVSQCRTQRVIAELNNLGKLWTTDYCSERLKFTEERIQELSEKIDGQEKLAHEYHKGLERADNIIQELSGKIDETHANAIANFKGLDDHYGKEISELIEKTDAHFDEIAALKNSLALHIKYTDEKLSNIRNEHSALSEQLNNQEKLFVTQSAHEGLLGMLKKQSMDIQFLTDNCVLQEGYMPNKTKPKAKPRKNVRK